MKKAVILCILLTLLCAVALAETGEREIFISGDYKYALLADGTAEITRYRGQETEPVVPSVLDGHPVTAIGDRAFAACTGLTAVTIPEGVKSIGNSSFSICSFLARIAIPASVESIGEQAFFQCFRLADVDMKEGVGSIGDFAFAYCNALTSVTIPDSDADIGDNPFSYCERLETLLVSPQHPALATINGVLFSKADKRLVC